MGLGVVHGGIAHHVQTGSLQALGKGLGVRNDGLLVFVLELVHLIRRHQHPQLGAQVVVGDAAGEGTGFDGFPQAVLQVFFLVVDADDAPLGAEEGLMGGACDDLSALLEGILEVVAHQTQHMSHVVHDGGVDVLFVHKFPNFRHRLLVQHHALAQDDQLRTIAFQQLLGLLHIGLVGVLLAHREIDHSRLFGDWVDGHIVMEGAHGLCGQVTTLDDVVVHNVTQTLGLALAVDAVLPVHQSGEHGHVGHLAAEHTSLHLGAAQVGAHLVNQQLFHMVDELGALIVEHVLVVEGQDLLMLGVPAGGVAAAEQADGTAGGVLRGDQVHAPLLPPHMVFGGFFQQLDCLAGAVALGGGFRFLLYLIDEGTGKGRSAYAHMTGGDDRLDPLAADVHFHHVIFQHIAVDVRHADGTLAAGFQDDGGDALALGLEIGYHGAAGDPAHQLIILVNLHARTHDPTAGQGDGCDLLGQGGQIAEITIHVSLSGFLLCLQCGAADEIPLLVGEADSELGHFTAIGSDAHFVAVQGQGSLHAQGVTGTQTGRTSA